MGRRLGATGRLAVAGHEGRRSLGLPDVPHRRAADDRAGYRRRGAGCASVAAHAGVYKAGFVTAQLFFGTWLFPLGYLVCKSGVLPRALGVILIADGVAVLVWFSQALLLPAHPEITTPGIVVSFLAEVGLALWLLVKGVKVPASTAPRLTDPSLAS